MIKNDRQILLVLDAENGREICRALLANSFSRRLVGLMFRVSAPYGIWFPDCTSIHTHWMRFSILALFLDADGIVLKKLILPPWRIASCMRARSILEIPLLGGWVPDIPQRLLLSGGPK